MSKMTSLNGYEFCDENLRTQITELQGTVVSMATATLPLGRSKGDINGDGVIDATDYQIAYNHYMGSATITDEIELWCYDMNGDGVQNTTDIGLLIGVINNRNYSTSTSAYAVSDYYGNWSWDTTERLYYYDISVSDVTTSHSCVVVPKYNNKSAFVKATCMDGVVRVYTLCCPVEEASCAIFYAAGDGTGIVV